MKNFNTQARQGDCLLIKIDGLPEGLQEINPENGVHILAHSETGHNHVMVADRVRAFIPQKPDIYQMFIQVDEPTELMHLRSFDTHEPIMVPPGTYQIRRQREHTAEGFRRAED